MYFNSKIFISFKKCQLHCAHTKKYHKNFQFIDMENAIYVRSTNINQEEIYTNAAFPTTI